MRFLGLGFRDRVSDVKTIWAFRKRLTRTKAIEALFHRFDTALRDAGYIAMWAQLVDSTLVAAPKQRNTDDEKKAVKAGKSASEIWPRYPPKARHKDVDAHWTIQFGKARTPPDSGTPSPDIAIPTFGYNNRPSIHRGFRSIRKWDVTDAAQHDCRMLRRGLLDRSNTASGVWADSAYRSKKNEAFMSRRGFLSHVHRRQPKGKPMPKHIQRGNRIPSKHRAPVEHVFAVHRHMMALTIRTIGIARTKTKIGLANITYTIRRLAQIGGMVVT